GHFMELIEEIKKDLKEILSEKRYIHSVGVMEMCEILAKRYNADVETAKLAGILHDIAKEIPPEEKLKYVEQNNIQIDEIERINTPILHGKIGADIAKNKYGVNEQIQKAIEYHTTTSPEMDMIAKIVYVSDKIELNRKSEDYDIIYERELAQKDLDETIIYIINSNIKSLIKKNKLIHPKSIQTRNTLLCKKIEN
ncbi:MAG: bis(5'-nucleosyl)-tetraphosphatase (symmetrical) YqeK, partial [Clostridia bacterium]